MPVERVTKKTHNRLEAIEVYIENITYIGIYYSPNCFHLDDLTTDYGTSVDNVISNVEISALLYESLIIHNQIEEVIGNNLIEPNIIIVNALVKSKNARNNNNFDGIEFSQFDNGYLKQLKQKLNRLRSSIILTLMIMNSFMLTVIHS
ncbi:ATP-dependent DNA helicase [Aphis craccivora]|uniref:ATP-dependent DNA helicase n=1 Tax=Aphis craccivora TaxID=307492 RepID=A0A6G0Y173_APHCR|nr:ATP-dependent DNA helicase [Aphis craccivora]